MPTQAIQNFTGIDAVSAPQNLKEGDVQTATNVDFYLEKGAALVRRGSIKYWDGVSAQPFLDCYRNVSVGFPNWLDNNSPYYFYNVTSSAGAGDVYRGTASNSVGTFTKIVSFGGANAPVRFGSFQNYTLIANYQQNYKDDGVNTTEWIKQSPTLKPSIGSNTLTPLTVTSLFTVLPPNNGVFTDLGTYSGTATFTDTNTTSNPRVVTDTATFTSTFTFSHVGFTLSTNTTTFTNSITYVVPGNGGSGTSTVVNIPTFTDIGTFTNTVTWTNTSTQTNTATGTTDSSIFTLIFGAANLTTNLSMNGTHTIGDYGLDSLQILFSNPNAIKSVTRDYSIGDSTFKNYYSTTLDLSLLTNAVPFDSSQLTPTLSTDPNGVASYIFPGGNSTKVGGGPNRIGVNTSVAQVAQRAQTIQAIANAFVSWQVARPNFTLIGSIPSSSGWGNIQAARITIEATSQINAQITNWTINGALDYPLTDLGNGYRYWETWATLDTNSNIIGNSNPSPMSDALFVQGVQGVVVTTEIPTGTNHGITHKVFYRQGGLDPNADMVGFIPVGSSTFTDTTPDIVAINNNNPLISSLWSKTTFPGNGLVTDISEPYQGRIFVACGSNISWSLPGMIDMFPIQSQATVSSNNDWPQRIHTWGGLVIVTRNGVFEMAGNTFEGPQQDWSIQKTGSRRGSIAPKTCIKTPYGILLFDYDGLSLYYPGRGIDTPIDWANEKMGDAFKGVNANDPVALKGNRIPAINMNAYFLATYASATFSDDKLYLCVPTGSTTTGADTLFVLNFRTQSVQWFQYPFNLTFLNWDKILNKLIAGTYDGKVMELETGDVDTLTSGSTQGIGWLIKTQQWTAPISSVCENIQVEAKGLGTVSVLLDGTGLSSLGTFSSAAIGGTSSGFYKQWTPLPINNPTPSIDNNISFIVVGTSTGGQQGVFGFVWDTVTEPPKITYYRTPLDIGGGATTSSELDPGDEKIWDQHLVGIEAFGTGSILGTLYVDDTVVGTQTITSPSKRMTYVKSYPSETYGYTAYTIWNASSGVKFKLYKDYTVVRKEPNRITTFTTDKEVKGEQWYKQLLTDINPLGGTVTGTVYINNIAIGTKTYTGSFRAERPYALPDETYGTVSWVVYNSTTPFKYYSHTITSEPEPERVLFYETPTVSYESDVIFKGFQPEVNVLGGVVNATLYIDGSFITSQILYGSSIRSFFDFSTYNGYQLLVAGRTYKITYSSTTPFKYYQTKVTVEPKPFGQTNWNISYKKIGGADELDLGRFWKGDFEVPSADKFSLSTATITSFWDIDGQTFSTNTLTISGRGMTDPIPFPPGGRGYLWQQRLLSNQNFQVWSSTLQSERIGVKGLSIVSVNGDPKGV